MTAAKSVESRVVSKLFLEFSDCEHDFGTPILTTDEGPIWFTVCAICDLHIFADPTGSGFPVIDTEPLPPTIFERIVAIRKSCKSLDKDAAILDKSGAEKYRAVSHDQVINMLRPLFDKHGVVSCTRLTSSEVVPTNVKWGERELVQYRGRYTVSYIAADTGEKFEVEVEAFGDDVGDKGPNKAYTVATKIAHLKTFALATGEDDEMRLPEEELAELTIGDVPAVCGKLLAKAQELFSSNAEDTLESLAKRRFHFEDGNWQKIPLSRYKSAVRSLEEKAAE